MSFTKKNKIWDKAKRADVFSKALYEVGREAIDDIGKYQDTTQRTGVVRKMRRVKQTKGGKIFKLHRASARGEPPAKITGQIRRRTKQRRLSAFRIRVFNDASHAKFLEPPARLHRPFFHIVIKKNEKKYRGMIEKAARTLT